MDSVIKFAVDDIQIIEAENYPEDEFAIARLGFLSSAPNSHKLDISNDVLMQCASTVLGKFVVAEWNEIAEDFGGHSTKEVIKGYVPLEQEVVFEEIEDGYIRAYVDAVISKVYASDFCEVFEDDNHRNVSVEMMVVSENENATDDIVESFNIVGITVLGKTIRPSSPDADIQFVRFEEKASSYFKEQSFEKRRLLMAEEKYVNHPIDTSKDAVYDGEWDGNKSKKDLIKEQKYKTLAPKACLRLEDGWEDREITKLGYPVMCLHEGTWVYSRRGLASALAYAKQHDDNDIVNKVEALYEKLGLDSDGKEESAEMSEIEFAAVDIGDMWRKLYAIMRDERHWEYSIVGIYEQDNKKFAILVEEETGDKYRLDFSLTEEGMTVADELIKVEIEFIETEDIRKFAEPEEMSEEVNAEDVCASCGKPMSECECGEEEDKEDFSVEELSTRIAELEAGIAERDNIIMEKDKELETLRCYRDARMSEDKAKMVASVLDSLQDFMDKDEMESCRVEGMACEFSEIDIWANKVKASVVDKALKKGKKSVEFTRISAPVDIQENKSQSVWDRIK